MKSLLIVLATIFCLLMSNIANAQSPLALQEKCSKVAKEMFYKGYKSTTTKNESLGSCINSYENHYNKKMDKCFILSSSNCHKKDESSVFGSLWDVFEQKPYAQYSAFYDKKGVLIRWVCILGGTQFNMINGLEYNKQTKKWDIVSEAYKNSLKNPLTDLFKEKFDNWVKPYMEE